MSLANPINQYTCDTCGRTITTVDRDDGTTPMFLECQFTGCFGRMVSHMYRVASGQTPTHEWYKPTGKVPRRFRQHVALGGLLLRKMEGVEFEDATPADLLKRITTCPVCGLPMAHSRLRGYYCLNELHNEQRRNMELDTIKHKLLKEWADLQKGGAK